MPSIYPPTGYYRMVSQDHVWDQWWTTTTTTSNLVSATWQMERIDYVWDEWYSGHRYTVTNTTTGSTRNIVSDRVLRESEIPHAAARMTPEQQEAEHRELLRERQEADRAYWRAEEQRRAVAQERALELMKLILTEEQWRRHEEDGYVLVTGSDGGLYRVETRGGHEGNVVRYDADGDIARLCAHPRMSAPALEGVESGFMPSADAWVAQILAIQTDETEWRATANVHRTYRRERQGVGALAA